MPGRNEYARLRVGRGGAGRARPAARPSCATPLEGRASRSPRQASHPFSRARGAGDRGRAALPEDARGARAEAAPAARLRTARPRRHGELRRVPADARGDRSLAAQPSSRSRSTRRTFRARRRARSRLERHGWASCRGAGRSRRPSHRPRTGRPHRGDRKGLHAQLVGCAASSTARHARGADRRPADERRALRGAGRAGPGALRGASRRSSPRASYSEERAAAARGSAPTERLLALVEPAARELGTSELVETLREPAEALRQLEVGGRDGLAAVAADLVARTAA